MVSSARCKNSQGYITLDLLGPHSEVEDEVQTTLKVYPPAAHGTEITRDEPTPHGRHVTIWYYPIGGPKCKRLP